MSALSEAEARHIEALCALFRRYDLTVPANPWPGKVERFRSLQAACEAGVAAEIANGAMYDRLLATSQRPDVIAVLRSLQQASQQRHLAAFRRCAQASAGGGGGRGAGHHRGGRGRAWARRAAPRANTGVRSTQVVQ